MVLWLSKMFCLSWQGCINRFATPNQSEKLHSVGILFYMFMFLQATTGDFQRLWTLVIFVQSAFNRGLFAFGLNIKSEADSSIKSSQF